MKKSISLLLAVIMVLASAMTMVTGVSASVKPLYEFNFEKPDSMGYLVNTHLIAVYDPTEAAVKLTNNKATEQDQGFTPNSDADEVDSTKNQDLRKKAAEAFKQARFVVITYKNISDHTLGSVRSFKPVYAYNMPTKMDYYADVIVPGSQGLYLRDTGDRFSPPFCMYPFAAIGDQPLKTGNDQSIYIKNIAAFKTYEEAEEFAKENVSSGKTKEYAYADQTKIDLGSTTTTTTETKTEETSEPTSVKAAYDGSQDMIEWQFTSPEAVAQYFVNVNNYNLKYDALYNATMMSAKKSGTAGDQGLAPASTNAPEDEAMRSDFVTNAPKNYKYMVLTYYNLTENNTMIHRSVHPTQGSEIKTNLRIKKLSESEGRWQRVVIDASNSMLLRKGVGTHTSNLCFFPLSGEVTEGDTIVWKSLAFFKTEDAAKKYAAEELGGATKISTLKVERTDKSFIAGYDGRLFKPEGKMTRAEAVTVITRLLVDETTIKGKNTTSFTDVKAGAWYYDYVAYLESLGYLKSYKGTFSPDQPITRAEFVELVYSMGKVAAGSKAVSFTDVPATHERYTVITAAASAGLVNGYPDNTFKPDGTITRAEVVKVLCAALGRTPNLEGMEVVDYVGFADIAKEHWAFPYVIEASVEHGLAVDEDGNEVWLELNDTALYVEQATDKFVENLDAEFEARKKAILESESEWTVGKNGTVYYVSNDGNDSNNGKSPETPFKTIDKLNFMLDRKEFRPGDVVLFRRGDEWHGKFTAAEGVTYSAYGEGPKPRILGSVEADDASQWIATSKPNIYKFKGVIEDERDVGNIVFNNGEAYGMRVLKALDADKTVAIGENSIVSNGLETWEFPVQDFKNGLDLNHHLAYYHDWEEKTVYLYCEGGNPGDVFDSIELSTRGNIINGKSSAVIDNLALLYGASHGMGAGSCKNLTVRNCEVGWIGGAIQFMGGESLTRFGNAIEIYGSANGYYVYNNYVHQVFDCGPTVQWSGDLKIGEIVTEVNVQFYGNAIEKCNSPLEVWLTSNTPNSESSYAVLRNCNIYDNLCRYSGYGFGGYIHQKTDYNMFYGGTQTYATYKDCFVQDNKMWHIRKYLQKAVPVTVQQDKGFHWRNNTIVMAYEGPLALLGADTKNVAGKLVAYTYNNETIRKLLADGCYGFNRFMYTLAPGQTGPAK